MGQQWYFEDVYKRMEGEKKEFTEVMTAAYSKYSDSEIFKKAVEKMDLAMSSAETQE